MPHTVVWVYTHDAHAILNQSFIYQPIAATLMRGLTVLGFTAKHRVVRSQGGSAARVDMLGVTRCGDVLIFVGEESGYADRVPWAQLRQRGVYTVYYNTEPRNIVRHGGDVSQLHRGDSGASCWSPPSARDLDEVWDYAMSNILAAQQCGAPWLRRPRVAYRHVPPAYAPPSVVSHRAAGAQHSPVLFGNARSRRPGCLPAGAVAVRNVRSDAELARLMEHNTLFVNVHKDSAYATPHQGEPGRPCAQPQMPLESVRVAQLLSAGEALIVSERANPADEALYRGIVHFTAFEQLEPTLTALLRRGVAIRGEAAAARQLFRQRFEPAGILRRSNATGGFPRAGAGLCVGRASRTA